MDDLPDKPVPDAARDPTRERLLRAAGEVFAQHGFRSATIRQISQAASANIAAVNYHFRDKESLYVAVLHEAMRSAQERYPLDMDLGPNPTPEDRLRAMVRALMFRVLDEGRPAYEMQLVMHEMIEPTPALDTLVEQLLRPQFEMVLDVLRGLMGEDAPPDDLERYALSIVGQSLFYRHARHVLARLQGSQRRSSEDIEKLAQHVFDFSMSAVREYRRRTAEGVRYE